MKKITILTALIMMGFASFAQGPDTRRKIEVTGSAETEVTPDIIYIAISLKEYYKESGNKKLADINDLERQLQQAVINAGIPAENFMINNISSYNYNLEKKKNPNFLIKKQYRIKVTDLGKFNQVMLAMDPKAVEYTNIESYDYSGMEALRKSLKIKALQAAKEKASFLAEAINDKIGDALEIQEINTENYPQPVYRANVMFKATSDEATPLDIDFKKIKLNYQMRVVFELKR